MASLAGYGDLAINWPPTLISLSIVRVDVHLLALFLATKSLALIGVNPMLLFFEITVDVANGLALVHAVVRWFEPVDDLFFCRRGASHGGVHYPVSLAEDSRSRCFDLQPPRQRDLSPVPLSLSTLRLLIPLPLGRSLHGSGSSHGRRHLFA